MRPIAELAAAVPAPAVDLLRRGHPAGVKARRATLIPSNTRLPATRTGVWLKLPTRPSWPTSLLPQQKATPARVSPQVWKIPGCTVL